LLFSMQYGHASFPLCAPTRKHFISWKIITSKSPS
jgi:hypothetical protein